MERFFFPTLFGKMRPQSENSEIPFITLKVPLHGNMKSTKFDECLQRIVSVVT